MTLGSGRGDLHGGVSEGVMAVPPQDPQRLKHGEGAHLLEELCALQVWHPLLPASWTGQTYQAVMAPSHGRAGCQAAWCSGSQPAGSPGWAGPRGCLLTSVTSLLQLIDLASPLIQPRPEADKENVDSPLLKF